MERKNPAGAIRAFRQAGFTAADAVLVLKFTNAEYDRAAVARLREEAAGLPVVFLDGYMDRAEVCRADGRLRLLCLAAPSEGFGLTMLESMRLGKPVIGTAYSGNMDFMTEDNSFPLPYRLTPLTRDYGPYMRGAEWAEPDLAEAARLMRLVHEQPDAGASAGGAPRNRSRASVIRRRPARRCASGSRRSAPATGGGEPGMTRSPEPRRARQRYAEALAQAGALRAQMRRTLEEAEAALDDAEENNRHLHRELDAMTASSARRLAVRTRAGRQRAWRAVRHPWWTTGTVVRGLAAAGAPATARRASITSSAARFRCACPRRRGAGRRRPTTR